MNILQLVARARRQLALREAQAVQEMTRVYHDVLVAIDQDAAVIIRQIAASEATGDPVSLARLFERDRLATLQQQVVSRLEAITGKTYREIMAVRFDAAHTGATFAMDFLDAASGGVADSIGFSFAHLNAGAIESIASATSADGSPLRALLDELPNAAGQQVRSALIRAVALGQNPRGVAAALHTATGMSLTRALTIARTEQLRAYRTATLESYKANSDAVTGWQWISARDRRTCAYCWAMHGSIHRLDEPFSSHPNCRCSAVPASRTWADILGPEAAKDLPEPSAIEPGADIFARLTDAEQREILGPAKKKAYDAGRIALADLVGHRRDPRWGPVGYERSLTSVLGAPEAATFMR